MKTNPSKILPHPNQTWPDVPNIIVNVSRDCPGREVSGRGISTKLIELGQ